MIVIDTSALVAMLANEVQGPACRSVFETEDQIFISAGTVLEALIVATRRGFRSEMRELIADPSMSIVPVTEARAELASVAYAQWGKSFHKASLNFGDCFAYATAKEFDCPLLYVGDDFARTDIKSAIAPSVA
ncbi:type II toxin-antitoxin system VapC family toxin [Neorhizobium sp. CSC1952]|uniref:type II toxin-antitoxin system VapC family toxin n=1 Tax=Neorhizobium sp. CSC1952 TaxID=2978974 RepID=UPI0025A59882|nr:type II toxin-antitoxin system VapC family toxin [Rhizobium sp. CSC1952]WJR65521.1 type II toxin-antitoxin system VapC family toxin [Rhizobium sp. CSC1952]